eukprot:gene34321-biopygen25485
MMCSDKGHAHYDGHECTAQAGANGEIVAEPEVEHAGIAGMDCDDREPGPVGGSREMQVEAAEPWRARLRRMLVAPVWDAAGAPLPAAPVAAPAVLPAGTGCGMHYRGRVEIGEREVRDVGVQVPLMSERAHLLAEALKDWPDVAFLVRGAVCRVGFPFAGKEPDEPYVVENYVGDEHEDAMTRSSRRSWLRGGSLMRTTGYRVASRLSGCVRYMDTRSPFGNRALPGIFMRYTQAIVAWMQAQGVPCVGYLDDFFMVARTAAKAQEMMDLLIEFVTMLGFKVDRAKCEGPSRCMEFLGVLLCTKGGICKASIDEERVLQVMSRLREMRAEAAGPGFALVAATSSRSRVSVSTGVIQDLKVVERVIRLYNGRKVVLHKEDVHEDAFATDASLRMGMGGHCAPDYFLVSWEDLAEMPQRDFYPFMSKVKSHIIYLELFAVWCMLALWAKRLSGWTLVVWIDNQCAFTQVDKFWGPVEFIPLLRKIFYLCAQHDIWLKPYSSISLETNDRVSLFVGNILTDALNRYPPGLKYRLR